MAVEETKVLSEAERDRLELERVQKIEELSFLASTGLAAYIDALSTLLDDDDMRSMLANHDFLNLADSRYRAERMRDLLRNIRDLSFVPAALKAGELLRNQEGR